VTLQFSAFSNAVPTSVNALVKLDAAATVISFFSAGVEFFGVESAPFSELHATKVNH
jgi:hypothetical protein